MKCAICKAENAAKNFDRGRTPSNLAMFRILVARIDEELAVDARLMDRFEACGKHGRTDEELLERLTVLRSQAETRQEVGAHINAIGGR